MFLKFIFYTNSQHSTLCTKIHIGKIAIVFYTIHVLKKENIMKSDALKSLALRAKNRLLNKGLRDTYSNANIKIINNKDEEFVDKVRQVLDKEDAMTNPLKYLMDESRLLKLDPMARERYLLETIERYQNAKRAIEKEKQISI